MIYAVSEEGVSALRIMASVLADSTDMMAGHTNAIKTVIGMHPETLGPHKASLDETLQTVSELINQLVEPVKVAVTALDEVAVGYEEIISNDRIKNRGQAGDSSQVANKDPSASGALSEGNSIGKVNGANKKTESVRGCSTFQDLKGYLASTYGIQMDDVIEKLDYSSVKSAMAGVESVMKEYPQLSSIRRGTLASSGVMSCSGRKITFNPDYFQNLDTFQQTCNEQSKSGFWVANSTPESIGAHEAAHGVEWAIIQANPEYHTREQQIKAWNNCAEAGKIVTEAINNIRQTPYGKSKTAAELIHGISGYAQKDNSETMAEAFADVYANGNNANPLSIEIKRITQRVMEEDKKNGS